MSASGSALLLDVWGTQGEKRVSGLQTQTACMRSPVPLLIGRSLDRPGTWLLSTLRVHLRGAWHHWAAQVVSKHGTVPSLSTHELLPPQYYFKAQRPPGTGLPPGESRAIQGLKCSVAPEDPAGTLERDPHGQSQLQGTVKLGKCPCPRVGQQGALLGCWVLPF